MRKGRRLSSQERRDAILASARRIFAERGFHGATTRELAGEAGVSEALLFKYFPTKEAIYKDMLLSCERSPTGEELKRVMALKPSTATLVLMAHHLLSKNVFARGESRTVARLLARSLSEDGSFGRVLLKHFGAGWIARLEECIKAARKSGDLRVEPNAPHAAAWFCQHLGMSLLLLQMPDDPVIDYRAEKAELLEQAVLFALRGMGLKEEAIRRHYDPAALALLAS